MYPPTSLSVQKPKAQSPRVISLILAGGQSRRMGQDKALLYWQGKILLQSVYEVAAVCTTGVYLISPWPERYQGVVPNVICLQESGMGAGPLVALNQALQAPGLISSQPAWVLLLACDMPYLDPQVLKTWQQSLSELPDQVLALVPRHGDGKWEPLCGFYRLQSQPHLQQFIQQGGRSFQAWLTDLPAQSLEVTSNRTQMFWNCNTPGDLM
jgi:molybdenum cofactor guanylyltransferase